MLCADCRACRRSAPAYASAYTASPAFAYHPWRVAGTAGGGMSSKLKMSDEEYKEKVKTTAAGNRAREYTFLRNSPRECIVSYLEKNLHIEPSSESESTEKALPDFGAILPWFMQGNNGTFRTGDYNVTSSNIAKILDSYKKSLRENRTNRLKKFSFLNFIQNMPAEIIQHFYDELPIGSYKDKHPENPKNVLDCFVYLSFDTSGTKLRLEGVEGILKCFADGNFGDFNINFTNYYVTSTDIENVLNDYVRTGGSRPQSQSSHASSPRSPRSPHNPSR